ncbi:MAG: DUF4922 domain-containing protein [Planctomycetota bacterium]|nr:DUF4922 domain-containing protein [Planctomycetota bacterium]
MNAASLQSQSLATILEETWAAQGRDGFLLTDPAGAGTETRQVRDEQTGVAFRFVWMPHRELRGDVAELERRGILNPDRDESKLFRDPADQTGRHCFLCRQNIEECHPMEVLVPMTLAGREYYAGANFAWIEPNHFTIMTAEHVPQAYDRHVLEAMIELHRRTGGRFRVLYNGPGAGATIPWHFHFQITTAAMPVEQLPPLRQREYPTVVRRFDGDAAYVADRAHAVAESWLADDREQRAVNLLVASTGRGLSLFVFPRDRRRSSAPGKGLVGGFEVAGDFVLSAPAERETFEAADADTARDILTHIRPPDWTEP